MFAPPIDPSGEGRWSNDLVGSPSFPPPILPQEDGRFALESYRLPVARRGGDRSVRLPDGAGTPAR
ncbi:MAG: hypothetical protein O7E49_12370, partial [Gemmatimonadetes bacterium]|nr:hypothetical protein [Gemmatimonadota bacterium]